MARYAIGDIHGCFKTYLALLEQLNITKADEVYILGDLIDRGPGSKAVMDHIMDMQEQGYAFTVIKGNHEWLMAQAIDETIPYCWDYRRFQLWMKNGGVTTMMNFAFQKQDDLKKIDMKYFEFLKSTKHFVELDNCYLVHAGFNFKAEDIFKESQDMFMVRDYYDKIDASKLNGKIIIHGHTPRDYQTLEADIAEMKYPAINIDTGCVYDIRSGIGRLCAIDVDTKKIYLQENVDKQMQKEMEGKG
ncbi:MAG: metallophosphoesterase [Chitinophagales bacterium]